MKDSCLTLVPSGGLANRMRAVASAYSLCCAVGSRLQVVWFRDWALNARFHDIFEPVDESLFSLREARCGDYLLLDRPRRRNFFIPRVPQQLLFDACIYEKTITPRKQSGFDFRSWLAGRRCYMSCYQEFGAFPPSLYRQLFRPVKDVRDIIDSYRQRLADNAIGMHIRRTDNAESIAKSPTSLFIAAAQRERESRSGMRIFLATDSEEVKREFREAFGDSVITPR